MAVLAVVLWLDARKPPPEQWGTRVALRGIAVYRRTASPMLASMGLQCRFTPTCSRYAEIVLQRNGLVVGSAKALGRIVRGGPWTPAGTVDQP